MLPLRWSRGGLCGEPNRGDQEARGLVVPVPFPCVVEFPLFGFAAVHTGLSAVSGEDGVAVLLEGLASEIVYGEIAYPVSGGILDHRFSEPVLLDFPDFIAVLVADGLVAPEILLRCVFVGMVIHDRLL